MSGTRDPMRLYSILLISALLAIGTLQASFNITYTNTTLTLNKNTSAKVLEAFTLSISNSSAEQYILYRNSLGLTLGDWQNILLTTTLRQHISGLGHSTSEFTFLPGPLIKAPTGDYAILTLSYYVSNVTEVRNIAPRKFEYTFNNSVFNFENTANGQALPANTSLNIIIPQGAQVLSINPLPDYPTASTDNYLNRTTFSWFSGDPLSQFSFSFVTTESLQEEVTGFFSKIYNTYAVQLYILLALIIIAIIAFVYIRSGNSEPEKK